MAIVAAVALAASEFLIRLGDLLPVLLALILIDIVTGLLKAIVQKRLDSKVSWAGMAKKSIEIILVLTAQVFEPLAKTEVSDFVALFFCVREGISIVENAAAAGLPIPPQLTVILAQLNPPPARRTTDREPPAPPGGPTGANG